MSSSLSNSVQKLLMAQAIKAAVKDAKINTPVPPPVRGSNNAKLDDAFEHRRKNLRRDIPVICYTHKIQFSNRREFRLHIKYQHSTEKI